MKNESYKKKLHRMAEIFKALGHPARLCIVCRLMVLEKCNVSKMQSCLELPQSTVSQHLAVLKSKNIIKGERKGVEVIYSVIDENVKKVIKSVFEKDEIPLD